MEHSVSSGKAHLSGVFMLLLTALIRDTVLSGREIPGCSIMFAAMILSQLSEFISEKLK